MYSCIDFDTGTIPEPTAVITERKRASMRLPPPRSKSPIKTFLQSPARRNPSLGPVSSPVRGSIVAPPAAPVSASVRRKLDFSNVSVEDVTTVNGSSPQKRASSAVPAGRRAKLTNGSRLSPVRQAFPENGGDNDREDTGIENGEDSYQIIDGGDDEEVGQVEEPEEEEEPEPELEPESPKKKGKLGRPKKQDLTVVQEEERPRKRTRQSLEGPQLVKNKGGRPKKSALPTPPEEEPEEQQEERPLKKARRSLDSTEAPKNKGGRPRKASSTTATAANPSKAKATVKGRKPKLATISEAESPQAQRGPPMPRTNRGLVILRRETPMEGIGFKQTRSGRNSIKPVAYWKNERIEYADEENEDQFGKFLLPRIKEVVRADEVEEPKRQKSKSKPTKSKKRRQGAESDEEEDEAEPWETEPGHIYGEIRNWDPEDQLGSMTEEREEELAISSAAIITREIPGASFKFAKTLTHPFFGSGMVDLPAGAVKKPKNSRKMQMVFFVFSGRVQVNVNDNVFRIGKGGMWQVPRGMLSV
jgi:centromere protein C